MKWTHRLGAHLDAAKVEFTYNDILDPFICAELGLDPIKESRECIEIEYLESLARKYNKVILNENDIQYYVDTSEGELKKEWTLVQEILTSYKNNIIEED